MLQSKSFLSLFLPAIVFSWWSLIADRVSMFWANSVAKKTVKIKSFEVSSIARCEYYLDATLYTHKHTQALTHTHTHRTLKWHTFQNDRDLYVYDRKSWISFSLSFLYELERLLAIPVECYTAVDVLLLRVFFQQI